MTNCGNDDDDDDDDDDNVFNLLVGRLACLHQHTFLFYQVLMFLFKHPNTNS